MTDRSTFTALAADILETMAGAADLAGWRRLAFRLNLVAAAVRWGLPLLL